MDEVMPMGSDAERVEDLEEALTKIEQWAAAYPLDIFPEPDWPKVAETLHAAGLSLDQVSASCMRHVARGMGKIASTALSADGDRNA